MVPGEIGILPEHREVTGTPRGVIGPTWASREKREGGRRGPRAPTLPSPNRTREGGRRPLSFPSSSSSPLLLFQLGKKGVLLPVGVGLPPWRALLGRPPPPPWLLYIRGRGAPHRHKLIYGSFLSRVRCPPPPYSTSVISSRSLGEALRR